MNEPPYVGCYHFSNRRLGQAGRNDPAWVDRTDQRSTHSRDCRLLIVCRRVGGGFWRGRKYVLIAMKIITLNLRFLIGSLVVFLLAALASEARATDVQLFGAFKGQNFVQLNAAASFLNEEAPMVFTAFAELASETAVTNGTLGKPNGEILTLPGPEFNDSFEFLPELNDAYPSGTYRATFYTVNDGVQQVDLAISGDAYPNAPFVLNFDAAQHLDPNAPFTVNWAPFVDGAVNDFVEFSIEDEMGNGVFDSPGPGEPGALNGLSTQVTIPAMTLNAGRTYQARLLFARVTVADVLSYPGAIGLAGYFKEMQFALAASGVDASTAPNLLASSPQDMRNEVPRNSVITFTFNKPMNGQDSIGWSPNVTASNFSKTWSEDQRVLYCVYNDPLPTGETITWTLNPSGQSQNFRDQADQVLPTVSGQFTTSSETSVPTDVRNVFFVKGRDYAQTNDTAIDLEHQFAGLFIDLNTWNSVTNGLVATPAGRSVPLPLEDVEDGIELTAGYTAATELDGFFPDGSYTITLDTAHDGTRAFELVLTGGLYPNAPTILNYSGTQTIDASNDFTLSWEAFADGTANDVILVEIENDFEQTVYEQDAFPGDLNGTATSLLLPANTLAPGRMYRGQITFVKLVALDLTTYPEVIGGAAYLAETRFTLQTTGEPIRPVLEVLSPVNGNFRIHVWGETGRPYTVEATDDLGSPANWFPMHSETAGPGGFEFTDFNGDARHASFLSRQGRLARPVVGQLSHDDTPQRYGDCAEAHPHNSFRPHVDLLD